MLIKTNGNARIWILNEYWRSNWWRCHIQWLMQRLIDSIPREWVNSSEQVQKVQKLLFISTRFTVLNRSNWFNWEITPLCNGCSESHHGIGRRTSKSHRESWRNREISQQENKCRRMNSIRFGTRVRRIGDSNFSRILYIHPIPHFISDCYIINSSCSFRRFHCAVIFFVETGRKCWQSKLNWPPSWKCSIISFA